MRNEGIDGIGGSAALGNERVRKHLLVRLPKPDLHLVEPTAVIGREDEGPRGWR